MQGVLTIVVPIMNEDLQESQSNAGVYRCAGLRCHAAGGVPL